MDRILKELSGISVESLRKQLQNYGESVGPITGTTKSLFIKKLARRILQEQCLEDDQSDVNQSAADNGPSAALQQSNVYTKSPEQSREQPSVYYGISLPSDLAESTDVKDCRMVFTDKAAVLKALKTFKGSRFKTFKSHHEAEKFSFIDQLASPMKSSVADMGPSTSVEAIAFKGPKMQELVAFRKIIERGDCDSFRETVWNNPRYLISSGDTPVILQEGFRYNALHVATKANQGEMCREIISTIENRLFVKTLYPMDSDITCNNRINFLTDLYLNMPDKGFCESPLHFACKFGFPEVVEVFASHPSTDRFLLNKHGESPAQVVCTRCNDGQEKVERIKSLLEDCCFVPLLRSEDNCTQAVIGEPWSPDTCQRSVRSPVSQSQSPRDPQLVVRAYAGPMSPKVADAFHKHWTTPPAGSPNHVKRRLSEIRREDCDKGVERIGRKLSQDMNVPWTEYWAFLKAYVDLQSTQGLTLLNNYLHNQFLTRCPEGSPDQGRLLEKNLKNTHMRELDCDSPKILDYSEDRLLDLSMPRGESDGLTRLDLRYRGTEQADVDSDNSMFTTSSDSSSESYYSSCASGSSDDSKFHNSVDSFQSQPPELGAVPTETPVNTESDQRQTSPMSGGDYCCPQVMETTMPGAFTTYRCARSWSTDLDNSLDNSVDKSLNQFPESLNTTSEGAVGHVQTAPDVYPSTESFDNMITALTEEMQNKLTISWALKATEGREELSFSDLAISNRSLHPVCQSACSKSEKADSDSKCDSKPIPLVVRSVTDHMDTDPSVKHIVGTDTPSKKPPGDNPLPHLSKPQSSGSSSYPDVKQSAGMDTPSKKSLGDSPLPSLSTPQSSPYPISSRTPHQRLVHESTQTSVDGPPAVFIHGDVASKLDLDVLRAIEDISIDSQQFPYIARWRQLVTSFDEDTRQSWATPARLRASRSMSNSSQMTSSPMTRNYPQSPLASPHLSQRSSLRRLNLLD